MSNRNSESRNTSDSRASQQSRVKYEEPNFLAIPELVKQRYASKGKKLRWVRISLKGQDDYKNVGKRQAEGWEFVNSDDVPEMQHNSSVMETGRYTGSICRGDVALCQIDIEKAVARQEYYEQKSRDMVDSVNTQLMGTNNAKFPIHDNSSSNVSRGGKGTKFQD